MAQFQYTLVSGGTNNNLDIVLLDEDNRNSEDVDTSSEIFEEVNRNIGKEDCDFFYHSENGLNIEMAPHKEEAQTSQFKIPKFGTLSLPQNLSDIDQDPNFTPRSLQLMKLKQLSHKGDLRLSSKN